jgi:two-component system sensor histidine kinase UhpB
MDLHDGVGIELGSIRRRLETLFNQGDNNTKAEARKTLGDLANMAEKIRRFSHALDPFSAKNLSLPDLLDNLLFDFENNSPEVSVSYSKIGTAFPSGGPLAENEKHLFFIAAELLNNISRHAQATEVNLSVEYLPRKIVLKIDENGIGYNASDLPTGLGLNNIRSRAQLSGAEFKAVRHNGGGMLHWVEMPL